jgi:hypothetical protein
MKLAEIINGWATSDQHLTYAMDLKRGICIAEVVGKKWIKKEISDVTIGVKAMTLLGLRRKIKIFGMDER